MMTFLSILIIYLIVFVVYLAYESWEREREYDRNIRRYEQRHRKAKP